MTWKHGETTFIGNDDLTGDVTITTDRFDEVTIPFRDLMSFLDARMLETKIEGRTMLETLRAVLKFSKPQDATNPRTP